MPVLTTASRDALLHVTRETDAGRWARARSSGERVSLASLHSRGYVVRRARRGVEGKADAAYEYQLAPAIAEALARKRAAKIAAADYDDQGRPFGDVRYPETEEV